MKKYIIIGTFLISGLIFAQSPKPQMEIEAVGNKKVKVTYYFENGQVRQEGFYKKGKLDGKWVSYDMDGNKVAIAEYKEGKKTGKWFFWTDATTLNEVDYSNNSLVSVVNWKKQTVLEKKSLVLK